MCVSPQALLSGLLLRIERDGHSLVPPEIAALLALGCPRKDLRRALVERAEVHPDRPFARVVEALDAMP
jgi:hypothetical protein